MKETNWWQRASSRENVSSRIHCKEGLKRSRPIGIEGRLQCLRYKKPWFVDIIINLNPNNVWCVPNYRNPHPTEERAALQCLASQETRTSQADGPRGDWDLGRWGGARPLGDQSFLWEVRIRWLIPLCTTRLFRKWSLKMFFFFNLGLRRRKLRQLNKPRWDGSYYRNRISLSRPRTLIGFIQSLELTFFSPLEVSHWF